jgi:uncharacterized protein YndB with AHSA1/START domain
MLRFLLALCLLSLPFAAAAQDVAVTERREADGTLTLSHEVVVPAPQAEVWRAISTPAGWMTWAVPVSWTVENEEDSIEGAYRAAARPGDADLIRQQFLARLPERLLVFRTTRAPAGFPHFETYARVVTIFELEPAGEGRTRVRLTGTHYADSQAGRQLLGFFRDGNRISLERLRDRFARGPVDWTRTR